MKYVYCFSGNMEVTDTLNLYTLLEFFYEIEMEYTPAQTSF